MGIKDIFNKVKDELEVVKGEATKDKFYTNSHTYTDEATAQKEFERSKKKLFLVNEWSNLKGVSSTFELHDKYGRASQALKPAVGDFIKIILPGSGIENWVNVAALTETDVMAEFTVHPSEKPTVQETGKEEEVKHFFIKEASSTFKVERQGATLIGYEIGRNEGINNKGEQAGDRAVLNTLIAEGGWAGVQALQWDKLTSYLVHLEESVSEDATTT